jgi:hypothetical protein
MQTLALLLFRDRVCYIRRHAGTYALQFSIAAVLLLVLAPVLAGAGVLAGRIHSARTFDEVLSLLVSGAFVGWIGTAVLFGLRLNWQIDLGVLLGLPLSFRSLFFARTAGALLGLPLVAGAAFLVLSASGSGHMAVLLPVSFLALLLLLASANSIISMASLGLRRTSGGFAASLALLAGMALLNYLLFRFLFGGSAWLSHQLTVTKEILPRLDLARYLRPLPSGLFAGIVSRIRGGDLAGGGLLMGILALQTATLGLAEFAMLRRHHLVQPSRLHATAKIAPRSADLRLVEMLSCAFLPAGPVRALFVKDLLSLWRIKYLRIMILFAVPYLCFFISAMSGVTDMFALCILTMPAFFLSTFKSNLIGGDYAGVKAVLSAPFTLTEMLQSKCMAFNFLYLAFCIEAAMVFLARANFSGSRADALGLICYAVSIVLLSDLVAIPCSVRFAQAIPAGKHPGMSGAGAYFMFAAYVAALALFAAIHLLTRHASPVLAGGIAAAIPLILYLLKSSALEKWIPHFVESHRGGLLLALAPSASD